MKIKDRIKALKRVKASELIPNPKNWRKHSDAQQNAMRGILSEVGWANACLVRETSEGLMIIDGHLRADIDPNQKIPCLVLDVTAKEADKLLATFDPLAAMAEANEDALSELLAGIEVDSDALQEMLDGLIEPLPESAGGKEFDESCADDVKMTKCPECGHEFPT